jgi:protein-L-isoaspartate(D-aspartate) O-methyltransferase
MAQQRLANGGYDNVTVHTGDGSRGFPGDEPYDAILVAAGGPQVPEALKKQMAIGGRLVIPVGASGEPQALLKVTRTGAHTFKEENLGAVRFVPLIGDQGLGRGRHPLGHEPRARPVARTKHKRSHRRRRRAVAVLR